MQRILLPIRCDYSPHHNTRKMAKRRQIWWIKLTLCEHYGKHAVDPNYPDPFHFVCSLQLRGLRPSKLHESIHTTIELRLRHDTLCCNTYIQHSSLLHNACKWSRVWPSFFLHDILCHAIGTHLDQLHYGLARRFRGIEMDAPCKFIEKKRGSK